MTNGANTAVVLYDVTLLTTPTAVAGVANTARVTNVQSTPGGPDRTDPAATLGTGVAPVNLTVANLRQVLTFNFGTVPDSATTANGTAFGTNTIEYAAVVLNTAGNRPGRRSPTRRGSTSTTPR